MPHFPKQTMGSASIYPPGYYPLFSVDLVIQARVLIGKMDKKS